MRKLYQIIKNMKYRHKLTLLLVGASLVPMTVLALYSHMRMSSFVRQREMEDMESILEQTRENIDSQVAVYTSLINYLTYSPDIEEIIKEKNMDNYTAYEQYTKVADPLLSVPKSYHEAIKQIQLFADSIRVEHEYTLVPLKKNQEEWWSKSIEEDVRIQWVVNEERKEVAAVRNIYDRKELEAVLCITLDYDKIFQAFDNITEDETGGMIVDPKGNILYQDVALPDIQSESARPGEALEAVKKECAWTESASRENNWKYYLFRSKASISGAVSRLFLEEIPLICICGVINRLIDEVYVNKIALKEFELKALQAQINPHFLYNTLSAINWMAIRSNQKEISKVTLALSTFYRTALSRGEDMVTMESCIKNTEAYLEIQLVMHNHEFFVQWDTDSSIKNEKVPKLLLQPVVENALEHGLDEKEDGEKILCIACLDKGKEILLSVTDNGPGMEPEKAKTLVTYQAKGYGLKNVHDRLKLLYGKKSSIGIFSQPGMGTTVEIRVPKEEYRDEN